MWSCKLAGLLVGVANFQVKESFEETDSLFIDCLLFEERAAFAGEGENCPSTGPGPVPDWFL